MYTARPLLKMSLFSFELIIRLVWVLAMVELVYHLACALVVCERHESVWHLLLTVHLDEDGVDNSPLLEHCSDFLSTGLLELIQLSCVFEIEFHSLSEVLEVNVAFLVFAPGYYILGGNAYVRPSGRIYSLGYWSRRS
jgi:hypothetical protein